jgi:hypothetical protein
MSWSRPAAAGTGQAAGVDSGRAYEYLLKRFSDGSGTRAGQFFTPREVVELIIEVLAPRASSWCTTLRAGPAACSSRRRTC